MIIIIDECLPKRITRFFEEHEVWTVPQIGLGGYKDTQLLVELDKKNIDVFITIDGNIEYQQQFFERKFRTIVIRAVSNRFSDLEQFKDRLKEALLEKNSVVHLKLVDKNIIV